MTTLRSVMLTVYNRPPEVLSAVLKALLTQLGDDDEVVIIDDGSGVDYTSAIFRHPCRARIALDRFPTAEFYPQAFQHNGYNNPVGAWTRALALAEGDRLFFLSSDTVLDQDTIARSDNFDLDKMAYHPRTINWPGGPVYCGSERPAPLGWLLGLSREAMRRIGPLDLNYLGGLWYEDNDLVGRILQSMDGILIDQTVTARHIAHPPVEQTRDVIEAIERNEAYTRQKWGGKVPLGSPEAVPHMVLSKGRCVLLQKK